MTAPSSPDPKGAMAGGVERRAPVQRSVGYGKPSGTVAWWEHVEAWDGYGEGNKREQDAERIAERGGFGYGELVMFLGHEPTTWSSR